MGISLLILLSVVGGLHAGIDYRNQTVECSFATINACFSLISPLGGNFSARYAEKPIEINQTCQAKGAFLTCIQVAPQQCNAKSAEAKGKISDIEDFVNNLCKNGTTEYKNFLNSSVCYNNNQKRRQNCSTKHASTPGSDAKTLCCKSKKLQECLKNDLDNVCPKTSTKFQNKLLDVYNGYTNALCGEYFKLCGGAVSNVLSVACMLLTAKIALLNF